MIKSERSAKIQMTKLEKQYHAIQAQRNSFEHRALSDVEWATRKCLETAMGLVADQMYALQAEAKALGFYVSGDLLRWWGNPTRELILNNVD